MPKLNNKKVTKLAPVDLDLDKVSDNKSITLGKLTQLSVEERVKFIEPIIQANNEQFRKLANTIAEVANFGKNFSNLATSIRLPIIDILDNLKLPNSEIIIHALDRIIKAFEDRIQVELIKVRWEEIKKLHDLNKQNISLTCS